MADEIAQVCQMEIEGTTMVIKGSVKVISWLAQAIKALLQNAAERKTEHGGEKHDILRRYNILSGGENMVMHIGAMYMPFQKHTQIIINVMR